MSLPCAQELTGGTQIRLEHREFERPGPVTAEAWMPLPASTRSGMLIGAMMFISYFTVTINYRAVAAADYLYTALTDVLLTALGWSIFKKVQEAQSKREKLLYIVGGVSGAQAAIWVSLHLLRQ